MSNPVRTIVIYNPISGHGHLDSWNGIFVSLCLEFGWRVIALTPDPAALKLRLTQRGSNTSLLTIVPWGIAERASLLMRARSFARVIWRRWDAFGGVYFYRKPGSEPPENLPLTVLIKRSVFRATVPFLFRVSYAVYFRLRRRRGSETNLVEKNDHDHLDPVDFAVCVQAAINSMGIRPDLVLNMYMDMYQLRDQAWEKVGAILKAPWAGIRFVPSEDASEPYYRIPGLVGMCFLDRAVVEAHLRAHPSKSFVFLPDVTESRLPHEPSQLRLEIEARAAGRSIVFLGGSIGGQKNLANWFKTIRLADPDRFFFLQIGEVHPNTLSEEDAQLLAEFTAHSPENLFLQQDYVEDETIFNDLMSACSIIYAVYRDFKISSNMLAKAARFRKPIVVSDRYLMGERVKYYGLGFLANEQDPSSILAAVERASTHNISAVIYERFNVETGEQHVAAALQALAYRTKT